VIRHRQIATVAEFEFMSIVRTKGYLLSTIGLPALMVLYAVFVGWLGDTLVGQIVGGAKVFGVIDQAGVLDLREPRRGTLVDLPESVRAAIEASGAAEEALGPISYFTDTVFRGFEDIDGAKAALLADEVTGFAVIPADFVATGEIDTYVADGFSLPSRTASENLAKMIEEQFLAQAPEGVRARIRDPISNARTWVVDETGAVSPDDAAARILRFGVPGAFIVVFLISLLTTTGYLVQGTATEKENRVVEVLLSAAAPDEILAGKLLGLGAAGLLQVLVWFSMVIFGATIAAGFALAAGIPLPIKALVIGTVFFIAAYFFYGAIMLAFASFGNTQLEVQKLGSFWTLLAALPMMFFPALLNAPHGTLARALSWIPFTSSLTVLGRIAIDPEGMAWWDLALALAILVTSTWLALKMGARLFRVGLLAMGSRPKLREIWRQARLSNQ